MGALGKGVASGPPDKTPDPHDFSCPTDLGYARFTGPICKGSDRSEERRGGYTLSSSIDVFPSRSRRWGTTSPGPPSAKKGPGPSSIREIRDRTRQVPRTLLLGPPVVARIVGMTTSALGTPPMGVLIRQGSRFRRNYRISCSTESMGLLDTGRSTVSGKVGVV